MSEELEHFLNTSEALEITAAVEHARWAHWQKYLHEQCSALEDGSLVIPSHLVRRWEQQIATPYADLSDQEKNSDRDQAQEYLAALIQAHRESGA
ncbi:hypothetical protein [Paenarthrobacter sp. YJN-5]|uniref:hypothetical protein n=1 Tax=Paenarthrobacter sp. YJN-5 TaxID=2735316 RepID=UPI001877F496|nr:hypothetical protein [Paenarthrobacter sp. YJN-5]QOT19786.1 hypothetical protein HMI59_24325 [Paenarthrobacter sp. YJN-5]